jgi:hypothetical protein
VNAGQTATYSVTAKGGIPLNYQWKKNGSDVAGATDSSYTTPPTLPADSGSLFSVVVSNSAGTVTSNSRFLTVNTAPTFVTEPADKIIKVGKTARFSVIAGGTKPSTYQWRKDGVDIPGATRSAYITPTATSSDNGAHFSVVVSNIVGNATSNDATLTVN